MKIAARARYALRLMIDLADNSRTGGSTVLREIARRQQISKRYLEQLASALKNANLVVSTSGRGGGYSLPRPPSEIKVGDIIRATIGEINVVDCVVHEQLCSRTEHCPSRVLWVRLTEQIRAMLDSYTLADLSERDLMEVPGAVEDLYSLCSKETQIAVGGEGSP